MTINNTVNRTNSIDSVIHEAARASFIHQGVRKTTIASIARDARVSRPTVYVRYKSVDEALAQVLRADAMKVLEVIPDHATTVNEIVECVLALETALRTNELYASLIESDPRVFTFAIFQNQAPPQLLANQRMETLIKQVQEAQSSGCGGGGRLIRQGDAHRMATMLLFMIQTTAFSVDALAQVLGGLDAAREEFGVQVLNYLSDCERSCGTVGA
ncbi:TetR/AcrR family transcriptional regulator [Corynebacterium ulceribovis]|uniref:TetR/AcrR family transcriptional regulator n=1 Tax=Corynebacterium ulceribovis TaxID=487732 RepID=UPI00036EF76C|nr:TetR/AcrR family transcriptional regulator [Corynebacterium ulceribovis]